MKKCPMMLDVYYKVNNAPCNPDCIGKECAAYVERLAYLDEKPYGREKKWLCAMMPREVWHDVEDSNA